MIKENKGKLILSSLLTLLPIIVGLLLWDKLPDRIATHWGVNGEPDSWSSKTLAVFGLPAFICAIQWIGAFVTSADPKSKNMNGKAIGMIFWICPLISLFTCGFMYSNALGITLSATKIASLLLGLIFIPIGNYLPKCKQNYTIGFKIPWTLDNEENWNATHRFGGKVLVIGGFAIMLSAFLPDSYVIWVAIGMTAIMALLPIIYSYLYFRKHKA